MTLERTFLVQRLTRPRGGGLLGRDNPFAFGGGLRNGGLSDEAMGLLRDIFGFDYMGSAEFEFGAVPEALSQLARSGDLVAFTLTVPLADVPANWRDKSGTVPEGSATLYVLCPSGAREEVAERVVWLATEEYPERLKENPMVARTLRPVEEWDSNVQGWLELDNAFAFFADAVMWKRTCALFGVECEEYANMNERRNREVRGVGR